MKIAKLIIYEGPATQISSRMGLSLPDGVHVDPGGTTTVITLPEMFTEALELMGQALVQRVAEKHEGKFVLPMAGESRSGSGMLGNVASHPINRNKSVGQPFTEADMIRQIEQQRNYEAAMNKVGDK